MIRIDTQLCTGCGGCVNLCPVCALALAKNDKAKVDNTCNDCKVCIRACPVKCISL